MVEFHADDYGLFRKQSERILECFRGGVLNGVSIMPNGFHAKECLAELQNEKVPYKAVHLNLVEGRCVSQTKKVKDLIDRKGNFNVSFVKLMLASYMPMIRRRYKAQIKEEIRNQIHAVKMYLGEEGIRIDSHCHFHMVPVVFDSCMEVIKEQNLQVAYIRMPREYFSIYWKCRGRLEKCRWINLVKALTLNVLCARNYLHYHAFLNTLDKSVFTGVMFSGNMSYQNVREFLPYAVDKADRLGQNVEVLFHPGGVYEEYDIARLTDKGDQSFLPDRMREAEAEALYLLKGCS